MLRWLDKTLTINIYAAFQKFRVSLMFWKKSLLLAKAAFIWLKILKKQ